METIKSEAIKNSSKSVDLDNFRSRYIDAPLGVDFTVTYPSTEIYTYEHHYFVLLSKSSYVEFKPSWEMRPDYTSFDMYGSVLFWPLILFVNNVYSIEDFIDLDGVYIPPYRFVLQMVRDRVPKHHIEPLAVYRDIPVPNVYTKGLLDNNEIDEMKGKENIEDQIFIEPTPGGPVYTLMEKTENFILSSEMLEDKGLALQHIPVNSSTVNLYLENMNVPQKYGYHYVLKLDPETNDMKFISWNSVDVFNPQGGMESLLEEDMRIKITYLHEVLVHI